MISPSERRAEHQFAGPNKQQIVGPFFTMKALFILHPTIALNFKPQKFLKSRALQFTPIRPTFIKSTPLDTMEDLQL